MTDSSNTSASDPSIAASRLTGADALFWQLVNLVARKEGRVASASDPVVQERLRAVHARFSRECAAVVERHLGPQQARQSLAALASPSVQQFLTARRRMTPALAAHLQVLRKRIAELDL